VGRSANLGKAFDQLARLLSPTDSVRLTIPQVRYLGRVFVVFRWGGGIGLVALVGLLLPPKHPYWLALFILWVAAYNGSVTIAVNRLGRESTRGILRASALTDMLSYFLLLTIFTGNPPGALIAIYPTILIECLAFDGAWGAVYGVAGFIIGFILLELTQQALNGVDLVLWTAVMVIIATSLTTIHQVILGVAPSQVSRPQTAVEDSGRHALPRLLERHDRRPPPRQREHRQGPC
jgi:hypothetical protein